MKKIILFLVLILTFQNTYSQDDNVEIITHRVALGETMLTIAKKYLVQPSEIYKLNKKANDGVSEGMLLYIPQPIKSQDIIAKKKEKREKERRKQKKKSPPCPPGGIKKDRKEALRAFFLYCTIQFIKKYVFSWMKVTKIRVSVDV